MDARRVEDAAGGHGSCPGMGRVALGLSLASAMLYAPLQLMSLYFWRSPQSVPDDAPGLALYILLSPFPISGMPVLATLLGAWCLARKGRDRPHAAVAMLSCAAVLLLAGAITPWVVGMPEHVFRMALYPESLDPTPDPIPWVRGHEYELD